MSEDVDTLSEAEKLAEICSEKWRFEGLFHFAKGNLELTEHAQKEIKYRLKKAFLNGYREGLSAAMSGTIRENAGQTSNRTGRTWNPIKKWKRKR